MTRRIFAFEENGCLVQYEGGYTDYEKAAGAKRAAQEASPGGEAGKNGKAPAGNRGTAGENSGQAEAETQSAAGRRSGDGRTHAVKLRFTFKEAREYETIEEDISSMEKRIAEIDEEMAAKASDYSALNRLLEEKESLEEGLLEKMERWEYLEDLASRIAAQDAR